MAAMKILINAVSARAGGGVAYLLKLFEQLPEVAADMQFLAAIPEIDFFRNLKDAPNLKFRVIKEASGDMVSRYLWENTGLISLCREWGADALFCVANVAPVINPGIPVSLMVQNVAPLTPKVFKLLWKHEPLSQSLRMLLIKWLTHLSLARADQVVALSRATAGLIRLYHPQIAAEVVYHGIADDFNPHAARPPAADIEPYFIYVSNLYVYKGLEYIVAALAADCSLPAVVVVGKAYDAAYVGHVQELARRQGVADRLKFIGPVPRVELSGWYAHAVAMVYTSWCENCPNILLESMACGCPVVAMRIGPMPEICGDSGFYARPFDGGSLALAMRSAMTAGKDARRRAIDRAATFTWRESLACHRDFFRRLVSLKS